MNKDSFQLWDCSEDLCMQINQEQLGSMWIYLSATPPTKILQVILESFLQAQPNLSLGWVGCKILAETRRKSRGDNLVKPERNKEVLMEEELKKNAQKRDDSGVPV